MKWNKHFLNMSKHCFISFLTIKYLWMFNMFYYDCLILDLSITLKSTKKSQMFPLNNNSLGWALSNV